MGLFLKLLVLSFTSGVLSQSSLSIQVTKNATHPIPATLYGQMWEDISHSGDGGLYAELLQNRAFQAVVAHTPAALAGWTSYQGATIDVTNSTAGVSAALINSLQVDIAAGSTGPVGFQNTGYWGIKVQEGWKYTGSLYVKSDTFTGPLTVSLASASSDLVYATKELSGISSSWQKLSFEFQPTESAANTDNVLRATVDGASAAGQTIYFGMFSLFPPTYLGRPNGMRIDLAEALAEAKPGVWRFPGGNNLEGNTIETRWKWNETIGPLENRPGRLASWGYPNTDGLGLMEYLNWIEDLGAEPIVGVWAGLAIGDYSNLSTFPVVPEDQIQPYVQEAINQIHFITGDAETNEWAKLRAEYGHPEPYKLKYIEIGNEDTFGVDTYVRYRWNAYVTGLKAAFPNSGFEYLATTQPTTALTPAYTYIDFHQYSNPAWYIEAALSFDTYPRNGTHFFIGEFAVVGSGPWCGLGDWACGRYRYPIMQGSAAEAAYMTGLERNSDVVFASAYAPLLENANFSQWSPNLITFDAGSLTKSISYYVQLMFATNRGTEVLATSPAPSAGVPLHWVASHDAEKKIVYIKVANIDTNSSFDASFSFDFPIVDQSVTLTLLSSTDVNATNTPELPDAVTPVTSRIDLGASAAYLNYTLPASSVAVFSIRVGW